MKTTTTVLLFLISFASFSQVYGDLFTDKRGISGNIEYTVNHSKPGKIIFDIVVDMDGKITSCELNKEKSTIVFTAAVVQAKNKIVQNLKFERGYHWPEFHRGYVQINTEQGKQEQNNKFSPPPY